MSSMTLLEKAAQRPLHLLPLLAIALIGFLGGCQYESKDVPLPSSSSPNTEAGTPPPRPDGGGTATVPPLPKSGAIGAGTYLVTSFAENFEITVPDGWSADGDGLGKDDPNHPDAMGVFVGWWPSNHVPRDACKWQGSLVEVKPSAKAFVDAMMAQTSTSSTPPFEVKVGDYSGVEFDHSVEGDVDIRACDNGQFCVHSEYSNLCTRWYSSAAERETYRVVNLNGTRAMFWVVQFHESIHPELTSQARTVFDSIVFKLRQVTS
ncbi:hypothetical protein [Arthrobacter sp. SAFR-044]|uniref:hypothetical protein n=1 Tax=Arthrobacter sp. SAFR-044 TaxID=3387278 RepID=UPI003F7CBB72